MPESIRRLPQPVVIAIAVVVALIVLWGLLSNVWLGLGLILVMALAVVGYVQWDRYTRSLGTGPDQQQEEIQEKREKEREEQEEAQRQREEAMDERRGGDSGGDEEDSGGDDEAAEDEQDDEDAT